MKSKFNSPTVRAISGQIIVLDGVLLKKNYSYKGLKEFDLFWCTEPCTSRAPGIIYWIDGVRTEILFKGNKTEYNKWVKPLVNTFNRNLQTES